MKKKSANQSAFFNLRVLIGVLFCFTGAGLVFLASAQPEPRTRIKPDAPSVGVYRGLLPIAHFDISPALRDMKVIPPGIGKLRENEDRDIVPHTARGVLKPDPVVQRILGRQLGIPAPIVTFNGPPNSAGVAPPDPNGDVGPNHVVVMMNLSFQIFNKTGTSLFGPASSNTLWSGFGGPCQTENSGDPVVLYDQLADRWMLSQFTSAGPTFYNCVAVSTTSDPTGSYYRYAITTGSNFPDYPKYGIFPDAYYISTREFVGGTGGAFGGVGAYAVNRAQVLSGNPNPQVISFLAPPTGSGANVGDGLLPADMDGINLPPPGSPEYYVGSMDDNGPYGATMDALTLWKFIVNFANPPSSSFALANTIPIASYNSILGLCGGTRSCIPQPSTTNKLDHLGYRQRPLFRAAYRNFGGYESIVTNQSVSAGTGPSGEVSGIRWWEVRSPGSSPVIFQEGTYAPGITDGIHRWMGSIAEDNQGNMALGFSAGNATIFPSVSYTGRLVGDPLGQMPQGEANIVTGTGSQTAGGNRWGDYTSTTVDPTDDCTFWHVNEWVPTTSASGWQLRIGAFKFASCTAPAKGTAHFIVTVCGGGNLANAVVSIDGSTYGATVANGTYDAVLPPGSHTYSISKPTFGTVTGNFVIVDGNTTNVVQCLTGTPSIAAAGATLQAEGCSPNNAAIDPGETVTVSFCVQNTGGANTSALVGTLQASGGVTNPGGPQNYGTVVAGGASVCRSFTFTATGACGGTITASIQLQDGATNLGTVTYTFTLGALAATLSENFDGATVPALPAGWTADQGTNTAGAPLWVTSNSGTPTPPADSVPNAAFTQDPANLCDNRLYSPVVMYSGGSQLMFRQTYDLESQNATTAYDAGVLEININGGGYVDIVTAGGSFATGGYDHTGINTGFANPLLPSRPCWSGATAGFVSVSINLPPAGVGLPVQFRWRMGSDNSVSHNGWRVDNVSIAQRVCSTNCTAPTVNSAVSRKTHAGAGDFDIPLPLSGTAGIECRSGGGTNDYTMVVTFAANVSVTGAPQAQVTSGTGVIGTGGVANGGAVSVAGNVVTIPLTNVGNAQTMTVTLNGVTDGATTGNLTIPMSKLLGDSNANGAVNASDASQTKSRIGQVVGAGNFRSDININAAINASDVSIIKGAIGTAVP
ncbi:MAG: dockerin type I domain-containing protein [Verrucomicrobiota bacterium]